jgi:hypothetical protein
MDDALNIAINYLDPTGHATPFKEVQSTAAKSNTCRVAAWRSAKN